MLLHRPASLLGRRDHPWRGRQGQRAAIDDRTAARRSRRQRPVAGALAAAAGRRPPPPPRPPPPLAARPSCSWPARQRPPRRQQHRHRRGTRRAGKREATVCVSGCVFDGFSIASCRNLRAGAERRVPTPAASARRLAARRSRAKSGSPTSNSRQLHSLNQLAKTGRRGAQISTAQPSPSHFPPCRRASAGGEARRRGKAAPPPPTRPPTRTPPPPTLAHPPPPLVCLRRTAPTGSRPLCIRNRPKHV